MRPHKVEALKTSLMKCGIIAAQVDTWLKQNPASPQAARFPITGKLVNSNATKEYLRSQRWPGDDHSRRRTSSAPSSVCLVSLADKEQEVVDILHILFLGFIFVGCIAPSFACWFAVSLWGVVSHTGHQHGFQLRGAWIPSEPTCAQVYTLDGRRVWKLTQPMLLTGQIQSPSWVCDGRS